MNNLKKLLLGLLLSILSFNLFSLAWINIFNTTIHNPETVKSWVEKSGIYERLTEIVIEESKTSDSTMPAGIPLDDPNIQTIAKESITPEFLRKTTEGTIDSIYAWLSGESQNLDIKIDLTEAKQNIANGVGKYAKTKAEAMPVCATNESPTTFDAFNAVCRPRGLILNDIEGKVTDDLLADPNFIKDPIITTSDLRFKNSEGQEIIITEDDMVKGFRRGYQSTNGANAFFGIIIVLLSTAVIIISPSRLKGLKFIGYSLASAGLTLMIIYYILKDTSTSLTNISKPEDASNIAITQTLSDGIKAISSDVLSPLLLFWVLYLGIGLGLLLGFYLHGRKNSIKETNGDDGEMANSIVHQKTEDIEVKKTPKIQL